MSNNLIFYSLCEGQTKATPEAIAYVEEQGLAKGVVEIVAKMRRLMPGLQDVHLVYFEDPTCDCDPELHLRAIFRDDMDDDEIEDAIDHFDDTWWVDNADRWDYRIEIHVGEA
jgi:hypothetical protein